jgi:hypothetical protein
MLYREFGEGSFFGVKWDRSGDKIRSDITVQ